MIGSIVTRITRPFIWVAVGLAGLWWVLESAIHVLVFHEGGLIQQVFAPHPHEIWMRFLVVVLFIGFSIYAEFMINRQRRAEEATKEAYAELNQVCETAADGMRIIGRDFNVLRVNDTFAKLSGVSKEEAVGRKCYEVFHGPLCHTPGCPLARVIAGEDRIECEVEKEDRDGLKIPCILTATPFCEPGGDVIGIVEDFKDISERKRVYETVRQSEEKYSILVENSLTGIYIDQDRKIMFANSKFAEIYGYSRDELIGIDSRKLVHPEDRDLTDDIRAKRLDGEDAPMEYEARGLTKKGETIWIARRNARIDYQGRPAILGNVVDITEQKKAEEALKETMHRVKVAYDQSIIYAQRLNKEITEREQAEAALRESEGRYRTVLEACPDPVVVYDMAGKGIYINPAFSQVFGWNPEELLGQKLNYVPSENWPETKMMIDKVLAGDSFSGVESRRYTKEGETLDVSISAAIYLDRDGKPAGSVHILRDITEQKRVGEELRKAHDELERRVEERTAKLAETTDRLKLELAERKRMEQALRVAHRDLRMKAADLEAANEELSQYAYVVSHDLKMPLRAIRNYTDFLREDLEATLDGDQKAYLDGLQRSVGEGEELVRDLLEFSRIGTTMAPSQRINIGAFLQELIASLHLSSDVEVVMGNDWPTIDVEPTLLRQVLQNLVSNAVKFNDATRKRIEIGWVPVGEDGFELFVADNGIGMDPSLHEQIFSVFQRLHTRDEYEGTGLGLAIVKKAVAKLHGSVRVESRFGEGSTFFVALPKDEKER